VFDRWWRREEERGRMGGIIYPRGEQREAEL